MKPPLTRGTVLRLLALFAIYQAAFPLEDLFWPGAYLRGRGAFLFFILAPTVIVPIWDGLARGFHWIWGPAAFVFYLPVWCFSDVNSDFTVAPILGGIALAASAVGFAIRWLLFKLRATSKTDETSAQQ